MVRKKESFLVDGIDCGDFGAEVRRQSSVSVARESSVSDVDHSHTGSGELADEGGHLAGAGSVSHSRESILVSGLLGSGGSAGNPSSEVALEARGAAFEDDDVGGNSQVTLVGLGTGVQDSVGVSGVTSDGAEHLLVVGQLTGGSRALVNEDTGESSVLRSVSADIGCNVGNGSGTIGSVHVSDHGDSGGGHLLHVGLVARVGSGSIGSAVGVDDGSDFQTSLGCVDNLGPSCSWFHVQGDQQLDGLRGSGSNSAQ